MHIRVKCYATLSKYQPEDANNFPVSPGDTLNSIVSRLGIDQGQIKVAFVNGRHATLNRELQDQDQVGLFPAVGGG